MASAPTGPGNFGTPPTGQPYPGNEPPQKKSFFNWGTCLIGCLGIGLLSVLVCAGVGYYIYSQAPEIARSAANSVVDQSEMLPEDKVIVKGQVNRVVDQYKAGKITVDQVGMVFEKLMKSPLFTLFMVYAAEEKYVKPSMLPAEEKAAAKITLQRVARGVIEKKIGKETLDHLLAHISTKDANGNPQFGKDISDAKLQEFLADCKKAADEAMIPEEEFHVKIGDELTKVVDEALKGPGGAAPDLDIDINDAPKAPSDK